MFWWWWPRGKVDTYHHYPRLIEVKAEIEKLRDLFTERFDIMSKEMDDLTAQVRKNSDLLDSATILINGIADRITAAGVDPTKLQALTDELKSKDDALANAIVAGTPSA